MLFCFLLKRVLGLKIILGHTILWKISRDRLAQLKITNIASAQNRVKLASGSVFKMHKSPKQHLSLFILETKLNVLHIKGKKIIPNYTKTSI